MSKQDFMTEQDRINSEFAEMSELNPLLIACDLHVQLILSFAYQESRHDF